MRVCPALVLRVVAAMCRRIGRRRLCRSVGSGPEHPRRRGGHPVARADAAPSVSNRYSDSRPQLSTQVESPTNTPTAEPAATFTPTQVENTATATPVDTPTETAPPTVEPDETERMVGTDVGDTAPGFVLASAAGPEFALESLRGEKSVVVIFYRAFW